MNIKISARILVSCVICLLIFPTKSLAVTFTGRLINGGGNYGNNKQYYFITSSAASQASRINTAMDMWTHSNGTGKYTPISFRQTSNQPASIIDFHQGNYYSSETGIIVN